MEEIKLKDGTTTKHSKLDRLVQFDERSTAYPVRQLFQSGLEPKTNTWDSFTTDQGNQGACVGHCVTQEAAAHPAMKFGTIPHIPELNTKATEVYYDAQRMDEWEGGEYPGASPVYGGTSMLAGLKAGMKQGWWKAYRWALGPGAEAAAKDVVLFLSHFGPVMVGSNWYTGMWQADSQGFLRATGYVEGGHAYLLTRYDAARNAVYTPNSWGGYGAGWITVSDLTKLLRNQGEAAMAIQHDMEVVAPEPAKVEPEKTPEPEVKQFMHFKGSKVYHTLKHYSTGKIIKADDPILGVLRPCKVCKP